MMNYKKSLMLIPSSLCIIISACVSGNTNNTMKLCDESGCRDVSKNQSSFNSSATQTNSTLLSDNDSYAQEPLSELKIAADNGDIIATYKLGVAYANGLGGAQKSSSQAAKYFMKAANEQHSWAEYRLAKLYADGAGVTKNTNLSLELTRSAANKGHPLAAYNLGLAYLSGRGVAADRYAAAKWFGLAAKSGSPDAQYNLAVMIYQGLGTDVNLYDSVQWMRKAAQGGHLQAQTALGRMYLTGLDTMGQDINEAEHWLRLAASRGDQSAKTLLRNLEKKKADDLEFSRKLALLQQETAIAWANLLTATILTAPRVDYLIVW